MEEIPCKHSFAAIKNLSSGFDGLTQLRAFFLSSSPAKPIPNTLAIGILDKALRCITAALSELQTVSPCLINAATPPTIEGIKNSTDPKKRKRIQSWTIATTVPHFDGHQWRKYGQKRILNSKFPRSYYKCAHNKDQGCLATKTIQQNEDRMSTTPKYKVSYSMPHTCRPKETQEIPFVMDSSAIINTTSSTAASSTKYSSQELSISNCHAASSDQLQALPFEVEEFELDCLMESMLFSSWPREAEINGTEDSRKRSTLATLDFDWEWQDELILLGEVGNGIV